MMALSGAGMLKALLILGNTVGVLQENSGAYMILYAAADAILIFTYSFSIYISQIF